MDFSFLLNGRYVGILLGGLFLTLLLAIIAVGSGTALALVPAFLRLSKNRLLRFLGTAYVEVIRGTPLLVQVLIIYSFFRMPVTVVLGIDLSSFLPGMLALFINSSAYVAEVIRGVEDRGALDRCDAVLSGYQGAEDVGEVILDAVRGSGTLPAFSGRVTG